MVKCNENNSSIEIDIVDEYLILYSEHMTDEIVNKLLSTPYVRKVHMMTSSNGNIFRVTGPCAVNPTHKGQWRGALMFSLISVWINGWVNNREAGDLRRYRGHYDVIVMKTWDHFLNRLSRVTSARFQPMGEDMCNVFSHWITPCSRDPKTIEIIA